MIEEFRISKLGVIDEAVLELHPGLNVVTGETGAGKTMVVTGLGLLFGDRADSSLVRTGASRAVVDGQLRLPGSAANIRDRLDAIGADIDEDSLVVSRIVGADGRSRAQLGGRPAPVGALVDLADDLIAVHGQSDQARLRSMVRQRDAIDRFGGTAISNALAAYSIAYRAHLDVEKTLTTITEHASQRSREADALRFGLSEIAVVNPMVGEASALRGEVGRLSYADALRSAVSGAHALLLGDPMESDHRDVVGMVAAAGDLLERAGEHDPGLLDIAKRVAEAGYILSDTATDLASYTQTLEADPLRLAVAQERQATLRGLARKYGDDGQARGDDADVVLDWAQRATERLGALVDDDTRVEELSARLVELQEMVRDAAALLSAARRKVAATFGGAVTDELRELAMPQSSITVDVRTTPQWGPAGADEVELLLVPHPGAPARPIAKGASGGELSRVMLAVEVVFAGQSEVPTYVFDEVDAGVGGRAAVEVGRRLARLAASAQVIVVTHLPQVAAFADRHLVVVKSDDGAVTRSGVVALDSAGRVEELSRMLSGLEGSVLAQGHAAELLDAADRFKAKSRATQPTR